MSIQAAFVLFSPRARRIVALVGLCAIVAIALTGCSMNRGGSVDYIKAFEQREYQTSLAAAGDVAANQSADPAIRQRASLIAGMSAFELRNYEQAEQYLTPLRASPDEQVAGRARATLGMIAKARGEHSKAAGLLEGSGDQLQGDDAARAKALAAESYRKLGLETKARETMREAASEATDSKLREQLNTASRPVTYTLQAGAFSTTTAAEKRAREIGVKVIRSGQPSPVVTTLNRNGRTLYAVQVGIYGSQAAARAAQSRTGVPGLTIVARN